MKIIFLKIAEQELNDGFKYYQAIQDGLGFKFVTAIESVVNRIAQFPLAYPAIGKYSRRCLTYQFPYGVTYKPIKNK